MKTLSTFERKMRNPKFKKAFDKSYRDFLLSELLIAFVEEDEKSVKNLVKEIDLSPSIINKIRSGKRNGLNVSNFINIIHACGFKIILQKNDEINKITDHQGRKKHHLNFFHLDFSTCNQQKYVR